MAFARRRVDGDWVMETTEIVPLSVQALEGMLRDREEAESLEGRTDQRKAPRWPFQGTVELWMGDPDTCDDYALATCENLSVSGVGIRFDDAIAPQTELTIAVHQPEMSLHGQARVRHCTKLMDDYYIGLEFLF